MMRCRDKSGQVMKSGKWPCGVCKKGVENNSIQCTQCHRWIHKKWSNIKGRLEQDASFQCESCRANITKCGEGQEKREVLLGQECKVECVDSFCYLGDTIGSGGGAEDAARTRVKCAWGKFQELAPILTSRGPP